MSLRRRLEAQYSSTVNSISSISLPAWLSCKTTRVALLIVIAFFGSAYIVKTASTASTGYQIYNLENKVQELETDINKVEAEIADHSSMVSIQGRLNNANMVVLSKMSYYNDVDSAVAKR